MRNSAKEILISLTYVLLVFVARCIYVYFNEDIDALHAFMKAVFEFGNLMLVVLIALVGALVLFAIRQLLLIIKNIIQMHK